MNINYLEVVIALLAIVGTGVAFFGLRASDTKKTLVRPWVFAFLSSLAFGMVVVSLIAEFRPRQYWREYSTHEPQYNVIVAHETRANEARTQVAVALGAATTRNSENRNDSLDFTSGVQTMIAAVVDSIVTPQAVAAAEHKHILWVDDTPSNNVHERAALEAIGLQIDTVRSTAEAMGALRGRSYALIISDLKRYEPSVQGAVEIDTAGYLFLQALDLARSAPIILYTGESNDALRRAAQARGAFGQTNRPEELLKLVVQALDSEHNRVDEPRSDSTSERVGQDTLSRM